MRRGSGRQKPPAPWWGYGGAPGEVFPGVTIDFPATWNTTRDRWETHNGKYYFDTVAADRACNFFPDLLTHHIGDFAGKPFALLEYQYKLMTRPLFGWKRADSGLRRIRKLFGFLPKGNGKSPWASGTGIYLARCDGEAAAEVYAIASDKQQGRTVHDNAKIMVENQEHLREGCEILKDSIVWAAIHATYQVLSSDAASAHGKRPYGLIFDELQALKERELWEALTKSMIKRRQPVTIVISHAGVDDEGICFEEYEYAKAVLSGTNPDETCLPILFELRQDEDWTEPAVHARVNPGYGVTIQPAIMTDECLAAQHEPRKQADFKRYNLNVWTNQATAWIPVEWWDACDAPMPTDEELRQYPCAVGIDLSQKIDLTAVVVVFRLPLAENEAEHSIEAPTKDDETGQVLTRKHSLNYRVAVLPAFWLPEETLHERVKVDKMRYDVLAEMDPPLLNVTEGFTIDYDKVLHYIKAPKGAGGTDLCSRFPLVKQAPIGYDPAFATDIANRLRDDHGMTAVEMPTNYKLSEACYVAEALIKAGRVVHGGHRLLRQHVENVAVKRDDAGRIRPVKPRKVTKRVDGFVAFLIALTQVMQMPATRPRRNLGARVWTPEGFKPVGGTS